MSHDKIDGAISSGHTNWIDSGLTLAEHASVPDVISKDGELWAYFVDFSQDGIAERIGVLRSTDNGVTWQDKQFATIAGYDGLAVDPDLFLLPDGRIRLYFFASVRDQKFAGKHQILSAISTDGINFTLEEGVRYEHASIFDPDVVATDGGYLMYVGHVDRGTNEILVARSTDGLTFTLVGVAYDNGSVPNVIRQGDRWLLFTAGTAGITITAGADGLSFTDEVGSFFRKGGR